MNVERRVLNQVVTHRISTATWVTMAVGASACLGQLFLLVWFGADFYFNTMSSLAYLKDASVRHDRVLDDLRIEDTKRSGDIKDIARQVTVLQDSADERSKKMDRHEKQLDVVEHKLDDKVILQVPFPPKSKDKK